MIKDSGDRRVFNTGAVRDIEGGKGRCDLLPLGVIDERLETNVLNAIQKFLDSENEAWLYTALDEFFGTESNTEDNTISVWADRILDLSIHYEEGARKYGERNWEKGIPVHCYIDSAVRHYLKLLRGDQDEPHDRAFVWNILGAIWTVKNKPELLDIKTQPGQAVEPFTQMQKF